MSTIMKALRRVEGERRQKVDTERLHREVVGSGPAASAALPRRRLWVGIGLGIFLVVGAGIALRGRDPVADPAPPPPAAATPPAAPRPSPTLDFSPPEPEGSEALARTIPDPARAEAVRTASTAAPVAPAETAAVDGGSLSATTPPAKPANEGITEVSEAIRQHLKRRNLAMAGVPPPPDYRPEPTYVPGQPSESLPPPVVAELSPPAGSPQALSPYLAARAAAQRQAVRYKPPSPAPVAKASGLLSGVHVLRTVWHPQPGKRVAYVSTAEDGALVALHEGEVWRQLRVDEIGLSGVVFVQGDQRIARKVWVGP